MNLTPLSAESLTTNKFRQNERFSLNSSISSQRDGSNFKNSVERLKRTKKLFDFIETKSVKLLWISSLGFASFRSFISFTSGVSDLNRITILRFSSNETFGSKNDKATASSERYQKWLLIFSKIVFEIDGSICEYSTASFIKLRSWFGDAIALMLPIQAWI